MSNSYIPDKQIKPLASSFINGLVGNILCIYNFYNIYPQKHTSVCQWRMYTLAEWHPQIIITHKHQETCLLNVKLWVGFHGGLWAV